MQKNFKKLLIVYIISAIMFSVAGCGKYAPPEPYEGSGYPRSYPKPLED